MKANKLLYLLMVAIVLSVSLTSCDDDEPHYYWDDIVGSWESVYGQDEFGSYDIMGFDVVRYDFYDDYTGRYTYYSSYGLEYVDFNWYVSGDMVQINYYDGDMEILYYGFDDWGYLLLSPDFDFYRYTAYRPAW